MFATIDKVKLNRAIKLALDELRSEDIREFGSLENMFAKEEGQIYELANLKHIIYYFKSAKGTVFAIDGEYRLLDLARFELYKFLVPDFQEYSEYQRIEYGLYGLFDFYKVINIEGDLEEKPDDFPF